MGSEKLSTIDSFYWNNHRLVKEGLTAIIIGGTLLWYFGIYMTLEPWGPNLGIPSSPQRTMWASIGTVLCSLPVAIWQLTYWMDHQDWVAEANGEEYVPGQKYNVFTTKRIITSAIGMALFGVSGGLFWSPMLDVPGLAWQILAITFDPVVCWISVAFGFMFIRAPLQGRFDPWYLISIGASDAPILGFVACWWWRRWRPKYLKGEMSLYRASVEYCALGWLIHRWTSRTVTSSRIQNPDPLWVANSIPNLVNPWSYIQFIGIKFIGFYIGAAVGKYLWMKKPEYTRI